MSRHNWELVLACGHRYFATRTRAEYAVADESGELPEDTDDGIAWLDRGRPIVLEEGSWYIPIKVKGEPTKTPATWTEVVAVVQLFKLDVTTSAGDLGLSLGLDALRPCESCGKHGGFHDHIDLDECP